MADRFHYVCFSLPDDQDAYEALMQKILIDDPAHHRIVNESSGWTKEGDHMVDLSYIASDHADESERY